ncbi:MULTISPECIES: hypothetical protein [Actinomycetes]|uniref:hypothetical protein n=1 Tax=Actinomycetes TaxID=1760 RepID=UPI0001B54ACF|nr:MULTISPECIES: hypothetical protein [Actinomycetes]EFL07203.1 predicted protein [Streptomyces sp. AA4]
MTAWRAAPLPPDWAERRAACLERDEYRCRHTYSDGTRCAETTRLEADHIGDRDDHRIEMLRTKCTWHHRRRTAAQGGQAAAAKRRRRSRHQHPADRHRGT